MSVVKLREKRTRNEYTVYQITIPKDLVELLGWRKGDKLVIFLKEDEKALIIRKIE